MGEDTEYPAPIRRQVHRYTHRTRDGYYNSVVCEREYPTFIALTASCSKEGFEGFTADDLAGIVELRVAEGWIPRSFSSDGALLTK